METEVGKKIAEILFDYDQLVLPGLGAFVITSGSSTADQVQGTLKPPGRAVTFNENIRKDDGLLVEYLAKTPGSDKEKARAEVRDFIRDIRSRLDKKEIVFLPDVGRLYIDLDGAIQFLPDNTNFDRAAFGLPVVTAYPLNSPAEVVEERPVTKKRGERKPEKPANNWIFNFTRALWPVLIALSLLLILFSLYTFWPEKEKPLERTAVIPSDKQQQPETNEFPGQAGSLTVYPPMDSVAPEALRDTLPPSEPEKREAIIILGVFRQGSNAEKMKKLIVDSGYEAWSDQAGRLNRVGIQMTYQDEEDLQARLIEIRKIFNPAAWILEN